MGESVLYNLTYRWYCNGINTIYFGNYLTRNTSLETSCHNSLAAKNYYVEIAKRIKDELFKQNAENNVAYRLKFISSDNTWGNIIAYAVLTNYQIIITGIDVSELKMDECEIVAQRILRSNLKISGFTIDDSKYIQTSVHETANIYCTVKKEKGKLPEILRKEYAFFNAYNVITESGEEGPVINVH